MALNLKILRDQIKPLDLSASPGLSVAEREYFHYYGINFEDAVELDHYFGTLNSAGYTIACHYLSPKNPVGTCFVVHGYYDHVGLYRHVIEYCLEKNLAVVAYDLPGHGLSSGLPASISSFVEYQRVFVDVLDFFKTRTPEPWHVIAQSTGAAIVMDYVLNHGELGEKTFDKVVLLAPLLWPSEWKLQSLAHALAKYFISSVPRTFVENSSDPGFLQFISEEDPLQSHRLSLVWVSALKEWIKYFKKLSSSDKQVLIVQGRSDGTVDWQKNMPVFKQKFPHAKTCYLEKAGHHLINELQPIREKLFAAVDMLFEMG